MMIEIDVHCGDIGAEKGRNAASFMIDDTNA